MTHTEYMRIWRSEHPENREYQKEYFKRYYLGKNAEIAKKRSRKYYEDNKEYVRDRELKHYHKHKILKGRATGERSGTWKGDNAGYFAIHKWIERWKGKPNRCELCEDTNKKKYEWANKDHKYKRRLEDYMRLCHKCHYHYDVENGLRKPLDYKLGVSTKAMVFYK